MVAKGNVDKHRTSYSGGIKAQEEQKWGRDTAARRYGELQYRDGAPPPPDKSFPQFRQDQRGPDWQDDVKESSWLRGGGKGGEDNPNFDKGIRRPGKV